MMPPKGSAGPPLLPRLRQCLASLPHVKCLSVPPSEGEDQQGRPDAKDPPQDAL